MEDSTDSKISTLNNNLMSKNENIPFLTDSKYWTEKLKFNTNFKYYFIIIAALTVIYLLIINVETLTDSIFTHINSLIIYILALYLSRKIPEKFQSIIYENRHIFSTDENFEKYKNYVKKIFSSKLELYLPLIFALLYSTITVYLSGFARDSFGYLELKSGSRVYFEGIARIFYTLYIFLMGVFYFFLITIAISTLFIIFFNMICISKLGSDYYSIIINYKDLKIGTLKSFGKWAISIIIPPILIGTSLSVTGFFYLIFYNAAVSGYFMMITGITIALIAVVLLFKITYDLHKTIINYKNDIKKKLADDLSDDLNEKPIDFVKLEAKKNFYDSIDDIENWPFDFSMIKKVFLMLSTSVLPLLLSILKQFFF